MNPQIKDQAAELARRAFQPVVQWLPELAAIAFGVGAAWAFGSPWPLLATVVGAAHLAGAQIDIRRQNRRARALRARRVEADRAARAELEEAKAGQRDNTRGARNA